MRENIYGPENRVLSARLSQVTVRATASYSSGKETGTTLTVSAAGSTSAVPYRNVPKVASSGTPLSLIIAVVPDAGEHARVAVGKATLKAMALQGLTEKIPSDLYSAYCGTFLSSIIGKAAHSLRTSCTVSLDGRAEAVYDEYSRGLYPDTKYPYRNVYSYVVTGVPLCGGGLGTTTSGHDDTIEWGTSYDYSSFGLATLHTTCAEKESIVGIRYDPDTSRFFLTHYSVRTEGGVRYFKEETHDYSTVTYGSYGTFNVWDTCTYAQQFTRTTTSQSVNEGRTKEDVVRFTLAESPLPEAGEAGGYTVFGIVTLDSSNLEEDSVSGVFPCTVDVTANQWTVRLQGTFDTNTCELRTLLYNPLDVLYPDIIETDSPSAADPLNNFFEWHNTPLACNPPEGFYYCYEASGVVIILKSDILSYVEVPEIGKLATVFKVSLPYAMTARYFICTAAMLEEDKAKTLLRVGMDPEYIANTEMTQWDVEVRAAYAVLRGISNAATVAYGHFTRAADLGVRVDEGTVVATVDLWREAAGSGPSNMMGVTVTYMPAEHRGTKITRNRQVPGWLAMSPYGFEGYGSGVTSSITEEVPDTTTLSWASSAANVTDVLEYSGLCDSYSSVTNKVGRYTNSYARPMDTVTETDSYTVKASVGGGYSLLYPSNAKAFLVQNTPKVTSRGHKYTETREAAVAAPMIRVGVHEALGPVDKDVVLRDADGSSLVLLSLSFSGISTAYTTVRGVIESMTVTEAGTLTATCPAGTLDPSVLCSTLAQKPSVGVCKERIGLVYDAFLLAGDTLLCKKPPSVASTVFSPYDPEYSPYGVFVVRTASVEGYSSSMGMTFDLNDYYGDGGEDYRSPNGWEFRIVDAVTGKVAKVLTGPFYSGNQVGFSVPTWEASMPPLWYCLVAPYILSGGKKYYGQDVFTGPTLGFPTRMSFVGGTLVDRYHRIDRIYGENSYYGGGSPGDIPASQDNEAEYVMELAYLPTQNIIPSIGVGAAVQVWDIGEPVRYRPFIWFSSIKGAEGYCVGARAVSTQYLPAVFTLVKSKTTRKEVLGVLDTTIASNSTAISLLETNGGTGVENLYKIADLRDYATLLSDIREGVSGMPAVEDVSGRPEVEDVVDIDQVYAIFIDKASTRVRLLRNDFASYELLFAAAQQTTGCGFVQQAPGGSEPALMTSAWF